MESGKIPLVLVCCGSFSPITFLHLRMFEMANDYFKNELKVIGGILSPVADAYKKDGLAPAEHRLAMTALACADSDLLVCSNWEARQPHWTPTLQVLQKIRQDLREAGLEHCRIMLLIGADVFESFKNAQVWHHGSLETLLQEFGVVIVERGDCSFEALLTETPVLHRNRENITFLPQLIKNEVSSSKVRMLLRSGKSVRYLIPDRVLSYINEHHLYNPE